MPKTIISDTSCFIILTNIGELGLLQKVYETIVTTIDIAIEFGEPLPEWVVIEKVTDKYKQQLLEMQIDKGESSAIALALETPGSTVILDDYKARKVAEQLTWCILHRNNWRHHQSQNKRHYSFHQAFVSQN